MYTICVYDVEEKRCAKVMKILRKYLFHVQNSVFEGELTPAKLNNLREELKLVVQSSDSVIFYFVHENKKLKKEVLGGKEKLFNIII